MDQKNIVLAAAGRDYARMLSCCEKYGLSAGHLCYGITRTGNLLRDRVPAFVRGGIMVLSDAFADDRAVQNGFDAERLTREIAAEVSYRGYHGVFADFEGPVLPSLLALIRTLDRELSKCGVTLFVNTRYAAETEHASLLVTSQITGGSFPVYLRELCDRWSADRLALEVIPVSMDFTLPVSGSRGQILTPQELDALRSRFNPMPFYSAELAARYFTYTSADGRTHFVLYDDARTIASKLMSAQAMGIRCAFLLYREMEEILPDILEAMEEQKMYMPTENDAYYQK